MHNYNAPVKKEEKKKNWWAGDQVSAVKLAREALGASWAISWAETRPCAWRGSDAYLAPVTAAPKAFLIGGVFPVIKRRGRGWSWAPTCQGPGQPQLRLSPACYDLLAWFIPYPQCLPSLHRRKWILEPSCSFSNSVTCWVDHGNFHHLLRSLCPHL